MEKEPRTVIFPLRTNVDRFESPDNRVVFQTKVKEALLLYDRVVLQDGVLDINVTEHGSSCMHIPREFLPRRGEGEPRGSRKPEGHIRVTGHVGETGKRHLLFGGPLEAEYSNIDFLPDVRDLMNLKPNCAAFEHLELGSAGKKVANEIRRNLERNEDVCGLLPEGSSFLRAVLLGNLANDLALSHGMRTPIAMSSLYLPSMAKLSELWTALHDDPRFAMLGMVLELRVPDFGNRSWEEVLEFRRDPALEALRDKIGIIGEAARSEANLQGRPLTRQELSRLVRGHTEDDLWDELGKRSMSPKKILINLATGLLPPGIASLIGLGRNGAELQEERTHWTSVIMRLRG